jgi:multiple sugar transport system permease protein
VLLLALTIYPLVTVVYYSFFDYHYVRGFEGFVGLGNYQRLLGDMFFTVSVRNTLVFALLATVRSCCWGSASRCCSTGPSVAGSCSCR